jgi:hypothetical protein
VQLGRSALGPVADRWLEAPSRRLAFMERFDEANHSLVLAMIFQDRLLAIGNDGTVFKFVRSLS